jgi:hypothetical protein
MLQHIICIKIPKNINFSLYQNHFLCLGEISRPQLVIVNTAGKIASVKAYFKRTGEKLFVYKGLDFFAQNIENLQSNMTGFWYLKLYL